MKLTDEYPWGVIDNLSGKIVSRSAEGWRAAERAKALNRNGSWEIRSTPDINGKRVSIGTLGNRYSVIQAGK